MAVTVYKGDKYRTLAGKKIYQNGKWVEMPANAKMYLDGAWRKFGFATVEPSTPEYPDIPDAPEPPVIQHDNGEEPSGRKWYVAPVGSGSQDGSSWSNAAPGSNIHVIMLQADSGDSVYFMEGSYTTTRVISVPEGVNFYGGFAEDNPAWDTRDGLKNPSLFIGDGSFDFVNCKNAIDRQTLDGISVKEYVTVVRNGQNIALKNSNYENTPLDCFEVERCVLNRSSVECSGDLRNCNILYADNVTVWGNTTRVYICGSEESTTAVTAKSVSESNFVYAYLDAKSLTDVNVFYAKCMSSEESVRVTVHGGYTDYPEVLLYNPTDCTVIHCAPPKRFLSTGIVIAIFTGPAVNCLAIDCFAATDTYELTYIFNGQADHCRVVNLSVDIDTNGGFIVFRDDATNCIVEGVTININSNSGLGSLRYFYASATNCIAINCPGSGGGANALYGSIFYNAENCTAVNCSSSSCFSGSETKNCLAVNCYAYAIYSSTKAINCVAVSCTANAIFSDSSYISTHCSAVNCYTVTVFANADNSLSWNNECTTEFASSRKGSCAGSIYTERLALTLGLDNSIARFTNTGYAPAVGVQDLGICPSPITAPDAFDAYVKTFGDWHPLSNSFLIGKGQYASNVPTDFDGVARPDPPTIGAYEPKPEEE